MIKDITRQVAAVSVILAVVLSGITYLAIRGENGSNVDRLNLSGLELDLRTLTKEMLMDRSPNEENLTSDLSGEITRHILSSVVDGVTSMAIEDLQVSISSTWIPIDIPTQTPLFKDSRGMTLLNSLMYGSGGPSCMVRGIHAFSNISVKAIDRDGNPHLKDISYFVTSYDPEDALEALHDSIENDMNGWSSGLAKDMEYMLNTLVRARTTRGIGTGPLDVPRNVLNEGDVELALNIAIAVRVARWTGQYPEGFVENIDALFSDQVHGATMNPTGFRPWGEAEKDNFARYSDSRPPEGWGPRKASDLLNDILQAGHGDIADILFNYLYLDGISDDLHVQNPLDEKGPLKISHMSNPRQQYDTIDPYSMADHVTFPSEEGIRMAGSEYLGPEGSKVLVPRMDMGEGYLVSGRDFILDGINDMEAWYTNVDYTKTINDYTQYAVNTNGGNTTRSSRQNISTSGDREETRCGTILPPPPPPNHDWRLQWDLSIGGGMTLESSLSGWGGNVPGECRASRDISFEFDIRVHTWFLDQPSNEDTFKFENINDPFTDVSYNETASVLVFTPEANATEFFEDMPYQRLREGFEALVSLDRAVSRLMMDTTLDHAGKREAAQIMTMGAMKQFRQWSQRSGIAGNLTRFKDEFVTGKITFADLGELRLDGMYATLSYSHGLDRLEIEMDLPQGKVSLSAIGISFPPVRFEGLVVSPYDVTISLDSGDGTYLISGSLDGHSFTDGSGRTLTPPGAVTSLIIDTDWTITSPYKMYEPLAKTNPYRASFEGPDDISLSYSYVISGYDTMDPKDIIPLLSDALIPSIDDGYTDIISRGMSIASTLDRGEKTPWLGFSVRYAGGQDEPYSRTLWFRPTGDPGYIDLMSAPALRSSLFGMLWTERVEMPDRDLWDERISADLIMVRETTVDNVPIQNEIRATDILFVSHIPLGYDGMITIWAFSENGPRASPYEHVSEDWYHNKSADPSPLW